jgi:hypothetical protein
MNTISRSGLFLLLCIGVASLTSCDPPPAYGSGSLEVATKFVDTNMAYYLPEIGACLGEAVSINWEVFEGTGSSLTASPSQNIEPALEPGLGKGKGERNVTFKDTLTLSFIVTGTEYNDEETITIKRMPDAICTGFPLELRGNYAGTLEQTTPQPASLPHALNIQWEVTKNVLGGLLIRGATSPDPNAPLQSNNIRCTPLELEDKLTCVYTSSGATVLTLEGTVTATGYSGTYQGVLEGLTFQTSVSGTFNFVKQ